MGLAISRAIMELHGGTVAAYSDGVGKGTSFTVTIPIMPVNAQLEPASRIHPTEWTEISLECPPEINGLRLLVVDDDADTCEIIRAVLERCGGNVETSTAAVPALEIFRGSQPDVLISDIGLPEIDGYEFIRRVRAEEHTLGVKTPAVALTAFARIEDRVKALSAGYQRMSPSRSSPQSF